VTRDVWHQTWVTDRGRLLVIEGHLVRETAVRSIDGQKSWQPWFDLIFRPHAG
jgi:hypothetical protein